MEKFNPHALALLPEQRKFYIQQHCDWVVNLNQSGIKISSGYLVDSSLKPGGGGLLTLQAECFTKAKEIVEQDPIILAGLVNWSLHQWIPIDQSLDFFILDSHS